MVRFIPVICPFCGAQVDVEEGRKMAYCTYCGGQMIIDDGNQNISYHYRVTDDAKIEHERVPIEIMKILGRWAFTCFRIYVIGFAIVSFIVLIGLIMYYY